MGKLSNYPNLFLPLASLGISVFLLFMFFSKKNVRNDETKIYSYLVVTGFIESLVYVTVVFLVNLFYDESKFLGFVLYNKALASIYVIWLSFLLYYILVITSKDIVKTRKNTPKALTFWAVLFSIIIFILPIDLFYDPQLHLSNSSGSAINFLGLVCLLYLFVMFVIVIKNYNNKNLKGKFVPIYFLLVVFTVSFILRLVDPFFNITSNVFSFVLLVMYHTIENPDVKMIEKLNLAREAADKANLAKTEFLSSMSHEIRTPLNAIVGFSNAIMDDNTLEEAKNAAKDIIMASNNLLEIVNGILDISKIESGKMEIVEQKYNLKDICWDIKKIVQPRLKDKPIEFKITLAKDIPDVLFGDMGKIKEVITNLLTNAAKYTEKGIIELSVVCVNNRGKSKLVISVEDTGRGIKPEKIDKLFTKFQRLDEDKNTTLEGTGLGLAITKSLVEMMGGKIVVQSKYGSGSKFTVYLEQKIVKMIEEKKVVSSEENTSIADYSDKKILIVDDNSLNLKVAIRMLKPYKIVPDTVLSGDECLEKIKSTSYDLILMDDMMPNLSGTETLKELKKDKNFRIPVVVLTANAISGMKDKYIESGFSDYLAKPIDKLELCRILDTYLKKK